MSTHRIRATALAGWIALTASPSLAARQMENLDRGVVAVKVASGVFVSWRVLGTEASTVGFNLYRDGTKLNSAVITGATDYSDASGTATSKYVVKTVVNGAETSSSPSITPWAELTKRLPLTIPAGGTTPDGVAYTYSPNDGSTGDLDGDGDWDLVLKWDPSNSKDNSQGGYTGDVFLDGMTLDGTRLWRIDLGRNIRAGAHYTQFQVADYDGDGKAEVICKTAPGTKDASGAYLSKGPAASDDDAADYRNTSGYILTGPEYLTVFSGLTGKELATANYVPGRGTVSAWGDNYGNRVDRFLAGTAWLDGVKPSAVFQRGYYTRMAVTAWDWNGTTLSQRWAYDAATSGKECYSMGNHNLSIGDVDADGKDEIIEGSCAIDDNGKFLYRTGLGHGDAMHLGDLDPNHPGLEVWDVHEDGAVNYTHELHDAKTGAILWGVDDPGDSADNGRGLAADIDAGSPGYEMWSSAVAGAWSATGTSVSTSKPAINFRIYWDGDLQDEILDAIGSTPSPLKIDSWKNGRLVSTDTRYGAYVGWTNNTTKSNPVLVADLLGDWREEMILRQSDNSALLVYTTTIPTTYRLYTLMHDPIYRAGISWQNTAYNQPPHLGFWLGAGTDKAPVPAITLVGNIPTSTTSHTGNTILSAQAHRGGVTVALPWAAPGQVSLVDARGQILSQSSGVGTVELVSPAGAKGVVWVRAIGPGGESSSLPVALVR